MHAYVTHQTPCGVGIFLPEGLPGATIAERNGQEMRKIERRGKEKRKKEGDRRRETFHSAVRWSWPSRKFSFKHQRSDLLKASRSRSPSFLFLLFPFHFCHKLFRSFRVLSKQSHSKISGNRRNVSLGTLAVVPVSRPLLSPDGGLAHP